MSKLRICFSGEGDKNVSWFRLTPLGRWGSLTMTSTGIFVYLAHHFILLWLNPFGIRVDREGLWFEHSMPSLQVGWAGEGASNVSRFRLSPLRG